MSLVQVPGVSKARAGDVGYPPRAWPIRFAVLYTALSSSGCEELPEVRYATERVELAPYFDAPVCAGTLADLERFVGELEQRTTLSRNDPIRFYWGAEGIIDECPFEAAAGCSLPESGEVFGKLHAAPHEFAHAIGGVLGQTTLLLEEGFAIAASGDCIGGPTDLAPREFVDGSLSQLEFGKRGGESVGASFTNYLMERFGREPFHELRANVPPDASLSRFERAVADIYGIPLSELESDWFRSAPSETCGPAWPFDEADPYAYMFAPLTLSAHLQCDEQATKGPMDMTVVFDEVLSVDSPLPGMYADFTVVVPLPVEVELSLDGPPTAIAYMYTTRRWENFRGSKVAQSKLFVSGQESRAARLSAGVWYVALTTTDYAPTTLTLHIEPKETSG
jgi:hypothetical protein